MEEGLLLPRGKDELDQRKGSVNTGTLTWRSFFEEVKRLGCIAGPMVAVVLSQYLLQIVSMMMVGHLGELALSSTAIAISLAGVTGFSLFVSLSYIFTFFSFLAFIHFGTAFFRSSSLEMLISLHLNSNMNISHIQASMSRWYFFYEFSLNLYEYLLHFAIYLSTDRSVFSKLEYASQSRLQTC